MKRAALLFAVLGCGLAAGVTWAAPGADPMRTDLLRVDTRAWLELPSFSTDPVVLVDRRSGVGVAVRPTDARRVPAEPFGEALSFRDAFDDADMVVTHHASGFEDTTYFSSRPSLEAARYELRLENASGLRLFDDVLEVLDHDGTPRVRMARPWIRDRHGEIHRLNVKLAGCAFDDSPLPPWRRHTIPPGSDVCEVAVDWEALDIAYPAELDPAWAITAGILIVRSHAAMCSNDQGRVVLAGGETPLESPASSAEMYDLATDTWSVIAPMGRAHHSPECVTLADGRFLFTGGTNITPIANAHVYDPGAGTWSDGGMLEARSGHTLTLLPDGRVLAVAGFSGVVPLFSSAEVYDPVADAWSATGLLDSVRVDHGATVLPDGRVLVAGGNQNASPTCELFDTSTLTWSPAASMNTPRERFPLLVVGSRALAFGGGGVPADWVEAYDPALDEWTLVNQLPAPLENHHVLPLPSGRVLLFGGTDDLGLVDQTYAYDAALNEWLEAGPGTDRTESLASVLADGSLLVATGHGNRGDPVPLSTLRFVETTAGATCETAGECETSYCRDGVCCSEPCTGSCQRCDATGECVAVTGADDPDTCTGDASCDALGACKPALGAACQDDGGCASGHCVDGVCCDRACDATCEACDGASPGVCGLVVGAPHGDRPACPEGAVCSGTSAECIELVFCQDEHFAVQPDGTLRDCSPYICSSDGACLQSCGSVFDCAAPFVCDAAGACVVPKSSPPQEGCSAAPATPGSASWLVVALFALGFGARRERRHPSGSRQASTPSHALSERQS